MKDQLFVDPSDVDLTLTTVSRIIAISSAEELLQRRDFADALEMWLAALLAVHPQWTRSDRWFSNLLIDECTKTSSSVSVLGRAVLLSSQRELCFSTTISTLAHQMSNFATSLRANDFPSCGNACFARRTICLA